MKIVFPSHRRSIFSLFLILFGKIKNIQVNIVTSTVTRPAVSDTVLWSNDVHNASSHCALVFDGPVVSLSCDQRNLLSIFHQRRHETVFAGGKDLHSSHQCR